MTPLLSILTAALLCLIFFAVLAYTGKLPMGDERDEP